MFYELVAILLLVVGAISLFLGLIPVVIIIGTIYAVVFVIVFFSMMINKILGK